MKKTIALVFAMSLIASPAYASGQNCKKTEAYKVKVGKSFKTVYTVQCVPSGASGKLHWEKVK